ncbi:MAG TPA: hypothetical protein EYH31_06060 [Anaerolineae bacterium]|nr:hypothetical protein [Anaerolineae bacterium]
MTTRATTLDHVLDISKRLSLADQLSLISQLSERVRQELERDGEPVDMLSLAGLGAEFWQEIDVDAYLERERASWES